MCSQVLHAAAAAAAGDVKLLETYLSQPDCSVDAADYDDRTALHLAASEGRAETVEYLVAKAGANANPVDRWGGTPLQDALRHKHLEVATILLQHGGTTGLQVGLSGGRGRWAWAMGVGRDRGSAVLLTSRPTVTSRDSPSLNVPHR